jgi:hypothetical protein
MPTQFDFDITNSLANHVYGRGKTWTSQQGVLQHSILTMLRAGALSSEQVKKYCEYRYTAVTGFESLLEAAYNKAVAEGKSSVAQELLYNLRDERGLERVCGEPIKGAAHKDWRADFLAALGIENNKTPQYNIYKFSEEDNLATLCGMLLAAEFTIPPENKIVLAALEVAFPDIFRVSGQEATAEQQKALRYLVDHIKHDGQSHFPDLRKAISADLEKEGAEVKLGIARFAFMRCSFMDNVQKQLGLVISEPAAALLL